MRGGVAVGAEAAPSGDMAWHLEERPIDGTPSSSWGPQPPPAIWQEGKQYPSL
jgi:hypothetical protein